MQDIKKNKEWKKCYYFLCTVWLPLLISPVIFIALTNKVTNKATKALFIMGIGRAVISIWNYLSNIQHRDLQPRYTEKRHSA